MRAKLMDAFSRSFSWGRYLSENLLRFSTEPNKIAAWQWGVLGFFLLFSCFYGLGAYPILDMNEGLYAEIAREMMTQKHFIIPYLNNVPYLEKPPLLYWLIALSYRIFGINAWAARLVPATFLALTALSIFWAGQKFFNPRTGFIAALVLLSSFVMVMIGRTVFFDPVLTFWVTGSLLAFYKGYQEKNNPSQQEKWWMVSTVFLALSVLTKGFLTLFLLPLIMGLFLFLMGTERAGYKVWLSKKNIIAFLVIVLPWHLMVMVCLPSFSYEYFINNQLLRFFNARIPHDYHQGPLYFYIPRLIVYLLPWAVFLPAAVMTRAFFSRLKKEKKAFFSERPFLIFSLLWFLIPFVFFSIAGEKGDYYMVLGTVPLIYGIAHKIETWFAAGQVGRLMFGFGLIVAGLVIAGVASLLFYMAPASLVFSDNKIPAFLASSIVYLTAFLVLYGLAGGILFYKMRLPEGPFLGIAILIIPLMLFYVSLREQGAFMYSQKPLADYVQMQYEHRLVYFYQDFEAFSSFVFYNREPAIMVDSHSADLYFGEKWSAKRDKAQKDTFISQEAFFKQAKKQSLYCVIKADKLKTFQKIPDSAPFCAVQRNGNVLLLSNAPEDCQALVQTGVQKTVDFDIARLKPKAS